MSTLSDVGGELAGAHEWLTIRPRAGLWLPGRPVARPQLVVVHSTEGGTAAGAATWFQNAAARGSAHVAIDDEQAIRCVDDLDTAYHAIGVNGIGLGLEIAGYARWSRSEWLDHKPRLLEAARVHAGWCRLYEIPLVQSTWRGYHSHDGIPGNDHHDPGPGFPWDFYLGAVRATLAGSVLDPPQYGRTLRVRFPDGRVYGGWTKDEAAYQGPAGGALRWISRQHPSRIKPGTVIIWRGSAFRDPAKLPMVARTIMNRFGGDLYGG